MTSLAARVDGLDGVHETLVADRIGEWEVMVGGGPERFVLTATAGDSVANAVTADQPDGDEDDDTIDLTVGGQGVDYPVQYALHRHEVDAALADLAAVGPGEDLPADRWER
ncbi:hypothetical protein [Cellulomonas triticagri]|uniref:Uncharacterized protein n=1 Tax=Cellulomonas triticagri TaxID=2483352 RepID=A0A3M2JUG8_9CELL|nr:hypothetical protein [Cellulomonas triticagri]RMI13808.1 hypothetical protein EBM89_02940 [Cellulomonas triticagri]